MAAWLKDANSRSGPQMLISGALPRSWGRFRKLTFATKISALVCNDIRLLRGVVPRWHKCQSSSQSITSNSPLTACLSVRACFAVSRRENGIWKEIALKAFDGAPERIRTSGLCLRRAALYPAELRALIGWLCEVNTCKTGGDFREFWC